MDLKKLMPYLDVGTAKQIPRVNVPHNPTTTLQRTPYTDSQGNRRNSYIQDTRAITSNSRTVQHIMKGVGENTVANKVDINFIKLQNSNDLTPQERKYISKKWSKDTKTMVSGIVPNLFDFQKNILDELCITGEIYVVLTRDDNGKLLLRPILSEYIDPTINVDTNSGNTIINGIEYNTSNQIVAYWYRKPRLFEAKDAYRFEESYTLRIAFQGSYFYRGTPLLLNNDFIRNIWLGRYNLAVKGYKALSITGVLKTMLRDVISSNRAVTGGAQMNIPKPETGASPQLNPEIISVGQASIISGDTHQFINLRPNEDFDNFPASIIDSASLDARKYEDNNLAAEFGLTPTQLTGNYAGSSYAASRSAAIQSHLWNRANTHPKIAYFMDEIYKHWIMYYKDDSNFAKLFTDGIPSICEWIFPEPIDSDKAKEAKAWETKFKIGLATPGIYHSDRGEDPEVFKTQWIKDNEVYQFVPTIPTLSNPEKEITGDSDA